MSVPSQSQTLLGDKKVSDLISEDTTIEADGSVVGTLYYVEDFVEFNTSDYSEQSGNYFPLHLEKTGATMTIKRDGVARPGKQDMAYDPDLVLRVVDKNTTFTIEVDGQEPVTINFAKATLNSD